MTDLITTTVRLVGRKALEGKEFPVELPGERTVCPFLVVTPAVALDERGRIRFTGGVRLTHTLTGRSVVASGDRSERVQELAQKLAEFDWDFNDPNHFGAEHHFGAQPKKRDAIAEVINDWWMSDAHPGPVSLFGDDEAKKKARENDPAGTLLGEQFDWWLDHAKSYMNGLDWSNPDHTRTRMAEIAVSCEGYSAIYLLAVLRAVAPKVADIAARELCAALDAGDVLGEFISQWRQEFADGKPLTLRGIPDHAPLSDFTA